MKGKSYDSKMYGINFIIILSVIYLVGGQPFFAVADINHDTLPSLAPQFPEPPSDFIPLIASNDELRFYGFPSALMNQQPLLIGKT
jgi:hypothetical protein